MAVPSDVRKVLEEAGVKFDDQGNIIEDPNETFITTEDGDDENEDLDDNDELDNEGDDDDESNDPDDDNDEDDDDEGEGDDDSDEDNEEEEPEPKKRTKKTKADDDANDDGLPKLTPKRPAEEQNDVDSGIADIKNKLKELLEKGNNIKNENSDDEADARSMLAELRREAEEFRKLRFQTFADNVKERVNQSNYGAKFDVIINSTQWEEFLNKNAYGSRIGDLYRNAIKSQDTNSVLFFFDDFASKYLKKSSQEEESVNKQKDDLDDLAVPDKTKTSGKPKKRSKWDFEEADYITKLDEAERGIISREQFSAFSDKFEAALSKGRVKPSR